VKGVPHSADLRRQLHAVESLSQVETIFGSYLEAMQREGSGLVEAGESAPDEREPALT
jgi:hypothetical protein